MAAAWPSGGTVTFVDTTTGQTLGTATLNQQWSGHLDEPKRWTNATQTAQTHRITATYGGNAPLWDPAGPSAPFAIP